jgi:transcriptional regulator with XRE-family HTH domain
MIYLELARRQRGLSQADLGNLSKVRISRVFIGQIENGTGVPAPEQAERLARALDVPVALLLQQVPAIPKDLPVTDDEATAARG